MNGITDASEPDVTSSLALSLGQAAKVTLLIVLALIFALALAVALTPPVMAAFGMSAFLG